MDGEKLLKRLVRTGTVTNVDVEHRKVRVKFKDDQTSSGWLYVLQRAGGGVSVAPDGEHTHSIADTYSGGGSVSAVPAHSHPGSVTAIWMPGINDAVLVLYLPVENSDGYVLGGV